MITSVKNVRSNSKASTTRNGMYLPIPLGTLFEDEHGSDNPRKNSVIYQVSGGVPFGYTHSLQSSCSTSKQGHPGHKIVVRFNFEAAIGSPAGGKALQNVGFKCHWPSKIYHAMYSADAMGNNAHEYFLNI